MDKRRLRERMGHLDEAVMEQVNSAIAVSFGIGTITEASYMPATERNEPASSPAAVASTAVPENGDDLSPGDVPSATV